MASSSFGFREVDLKLKALAYDIDGPGRAKVLEKVGSEAKKDVAVAVAADIGDTSMSHWRRGKPIEISGRYELHGESAVEILPAGRSRGPMRVLQDGRQPGGAYDLVQVGRKRKDGSRRAKSRGRNQGATDGKQTWDDAASAIEKATPKRVAREVYQIKRKHFG